MLACHFSTLTSTWWVGIGWYSTLSSHRHHSKWGMLGNNAFPPGHGQVGVKNITLYFQYCSAICAWKCTIMSQFLNLSFPPVDCKLILSVYSIMKRVLPYLCIAKEFLTHWIWLNLIKRLKCFSRVSEIPVLRRDLKKKKRFPRRSCCWHPRGHLFTLSAWLLRVASASSPGSIASLGRERCSHTDESEQANYPSMPCSQSSRGPFRHRGRQPPRCHRPLAVIKSAWILGERPVSSSQNVPFSHSVQTPGVHFLSGCAFFWKVEKEQPKALCLRFEPIPCWLLFRFNDCLYCTTIVSLANDTLEFIWYMFLLSFKNGRKSLPAEVVQ